jgi:hypothetical protein
MKSKSINRTYAGTRKHHHFRVTVTYSDGEKSVSGKVFNNRENADRYAARQIFLPTDVRHGLRQFRRTALGDDPSFGRGFNPLFRGEAWCPSTRFGAALKRNPIR